MPLASRAPQGLSLSVLPADEQLALSRAPEPGAGLSTGWGWGCMTQARRPPQGCHVNLHSQTGFMSLRLRSGTGTYVRSHRARKDAGWEHRSPDYKPRTLGFSADMHGMLNASQTPRKGSRWVPHPQSRFTLLWGRDGGKGGDAWHLASLGLGSDPPGALGAVHQLPVSQPDKPQKGPQCAHEERSGNPRSPGRHLRSAPSDVPWGSHYLSPSWGQGVGTTREPRS